MKIGILLAGLLCVTSVAAQYVNYPSVEIIKIEPKLVTTYQQQCQQIQVQSDNSTAGTVIGGVAGGILGHQVGRGTGRDVATIAGAVVGGIVGNRIGQDQTSVETKTQCVSLPVTVQRGEIVTFRYRGRTFTQSFD